MPWSWVRWKIENKIFIVYTGQTPKYIIEQMFEVNLWNKENWVCKALNFI